MLLLILNIMRVWVRPTPLLSDLPPPGPEWSQGWRWQRLGRRHRHPMWSVQLPLGLFEGGVAPPLVEEVVRYGHYSFMLAFPNQGSLFKKCAYKHSIMITERIWGSKRTISCPRWRVLAGFFLPFSKNSRPKNLKVKNNSRPFFSQKLNVSEIFEASAKKLKRKNCK